VDAEEARDLLRCAIDAGAIILDEIATTWQVADMNHGTCIEGVVGDFLQHQATQLVPADTSFLLQPFNRSEADPVLALEY
jgi:hypothetical protein